MPESRPDAQMIAVLCGGVGAARLLGGLVQVVEPVSITAIVNTADDLELHGLSISPDLDTITYTLAGAVNPETGWGLTGESFRTLGALRRYGMDDWFLLGDQDFATHLYRTARLRAGASLTEVTAEITAAWGLEICLLPMSDDPVRTRVTLQSGEEITFQEYFVKLGHDVAVGSVAFKGIEAARPTPAVLDALETADQIVIAPSNPIVSIGPILALPGVSELLARRRDDVVAVSPIIGGKALKGPADRLLVELGGESSALGVARRLEHIVSTLVIDDEDAALAPEIADLDMAVEVTDTVMASPERSAGLGRTVLRAGRNHAGG